MTGDGLQPQSRAARFDWTLMALQNHILAQIPENSLPSSDRCLLDLWRSAKVRAKRDLVRNRFECDQLCQALEGTGIEPVLLKGAAYQKAGERAGQYRRSSDLDILVTKSELKPLEQALRRAGFEDHIATMNPYDQAYYRNYMHELPPLIHKDRRTLIDVHHALTPITARVRENTGEMIKKSVQVENMPLRIFAPKDRFLHAALHNLYDDSFANPLRHMLDLYHIYQALSDQDRKDLTDRAVTLNLTKPYLMAQRLLYQCFDIAPVGKIQNNLDFWMASVMYLCVKNGRTEGVPGFILYLRSHFLRMPIAMLMRHLSSKSRRSLLRQSQGPTSAKQALEDYLR